MKYEDENTAAAVCQQEITPSMMWQAIQGVLGATHGQAGY